MAASFFVNTLQVNFESVIAMEHTGMAHMFKSLDTGLKGFWEASNSVYEGVVTEFFVNVKFIVGTIVSFVENRKMVITKDMFTEAFGLPSKGMIGFLDIPKETMVDMRKRFSGSDVPFRAPSKKKEMKMKFRLLHDIVAKALCAKAGSFDMVTSEKFDLMVAITAGLKVKWEHILFQVLLAMVKNPTRQSQGFVVQVSILLENLVKADLGELVKLHPQQVLANKSVQTYIKKNLTVIPTSESSKQTEDIASGTEYSQGTAQPIEASQPSPATAITVETPWNSNLYQVSNNQLNSNSTSKVLRSSSIIQLPNPTEYFSTLKRGLNLARNHLPKSAQQPKNALPDFSRNLRTPAASRSIPQVVLQSLMGNNRKASLKEFNTTQTVENKG
ncbi:hypothetical protein F511_25352 [Dorcoceras hygrometricum]|uniref:Dystroglycan-like n=1 Tax=Dorcoceras hygrometricum TaxID=472368 RepID=A0A2Z7BY94_9LAMI|nr:hypothetical protein F511_25352 [Dorcoceras hygrometricum]